MELNRRGFFSIISAGGLALVLPKSICAAPPHRPQEGPRTWAVTDDDDYYEVIQQARSGDLIRFDTTERVFWVDVPAGKDYLVIQGGAFYGTGPIGSQSMIMVCGCDFMMIEPDESWYDEGASPWPDGSALIGNRIWFGGPTI